MNKIKITNHQFSTLTRLQSILSAGTPDDIQENTCENIKAAVQLCKSLTLELDQLQNLLDDTLDELYENNINAAISNMSEYTKLTNEIKTDTAMMENYISGSLTKFTDVAEIAEPFILIVTKEEIKQTIDRNFEICPVMSLGFKDGDYALLFGEDENTIDIEPFIFAKGNKEDYDAVQRFIETFLDLEEID